MCSIGTALVAPLLMGVTGAAQSVMSQKAQVEGAYQQQLGQYTQQQLNYNAQLAQNEIVKRRTDDEARVRNREALLKYQQIQLAEQEANASATQQKTEAAREIQRAQSLAKLSAIEGNAAGNSADRIAVDMGFTLGQKFGAIETTRVSQIDQLQNEKEAAKLSAYTLPAYLYTGPAPVKPEKGNVSYLGAALTGVSGYIGAGGNFNFLSGIGSSLSNSCDPCSRFN